MAKLARKTGRKAVVRLNVAGPITILGCAAQGCKEFILGGRLVESKFVAELISPGKKKK